MPRLIPAEPGKAVAGGGAFLASGVILVAVGTLIGLLMSGLVRLPPNTSHARIGLAPVLAPHNPRARAPARAPAPVPPTVALPPLLPSASPPRAAVPSPARAVVPPPRRPLAAPRPSHASPGCQRGECKRPAPPLRAWAPPLPSLSASVSSLTPVPAAGEA